jgi:hypothetical protein
MGLFEPHGRHGCGDGEVDLRSTAQISQKFWGASGRPFSLPQVSHDLDAKAMQSKHSRTAAMAIVSANMMAILKSCEREKAIRANPAQRRKETP